MASYSKFMVEFRCVCELRPARRSPSLFPSCVGVRSCAIASVDEASLGRGQHLLCREVSLERRLIARDCVSRVEPDEMR